MTKSKFEDLPNELFFHFRIYLTSNDLFKAFFNLNIRYNNLLFSLTNLSYQVNSNVKQQELETECFISQISNLIIAEASGCVAISSKFTRIQSLSLYRPIRLNHQILISLKVLKVDLTNVRVKQFSHLFSLVFSTEFLCLSVLQILHRKSSVIGYWKLLIYSIKKPSLTLKEFLFDVKPTLQWNMFEHFFKFLPNLERLVIRDLNTRSKWSCLRFGQLLKKYLTNLNHLFLQINLLNTNNFLIDNETWQRYHPLFKLIQSKGVNSRKAYTKVIMKSNI